MNPAKISVLALALLMTGAVDGVSNLPSIALFGEKLIFFFLAASVLFLLPTGLVSAELCTHFKEEGGIYLWVKQAFGQHVGACSIWLQWINTMIWFPTCLTTLVGTFAYLVVPHLAANPVYLVSTSVGIFWLMTWLNLQGIKQSARIASWAAMLGLILPMLLILTLSVIWILSGKPLQFHMTAQNIIPNLHQGSNWTALTAVITSFLGMELATVHVKRIERASVVFPKALMLSIGLIIVTMGFGSLGVALVVPHANIVLVSGAVQALQVLFAAFHLSGLLPILGACLIFSSVGSIVNWLISPANGLLQAAHDGFLPKSFTKENKHGYPKVIFIGQAIVVSLVSTAFFLMPSVNGSYWFLLDLSTEVYVMMYLLMFTAAMVHFWKFKKINVIPGGKWGAIGLASLGMVGCILTFIVGFIPPATVNVGSATHFIGCFVLGLLAVSSPAVLLMIYRHKFYKT